MSGRFLKYGSQKPVHSEQEMNKNGEESTPNQMAAATCGTLSPNLFERLQTHTHVSARTNTLRS